MKELINIRSWDRWDVTCCYCCCVRGSHLISVIFFIHIILEAFLGGTSRLRGWSWTFEITACFNHLSIWTWTMFFFHDYCFSSYLWNFLFFFFIWNFDCLSLEILINCMVSSWIFTPSFVCPVGYLFSIVDNSFIYIKYFYCF